jgi:hypothetical protein
LTVALGCPAPLPADQREGSPMNWIRARFAKLAGNLNVGSQIYVLTRP